LWDIAAIPAAFQVTSIFFQRLIGDSPPTQQCCADIQEDIRTDSFLVCTDGAFCCTTRRGSYGWVMVNDKGTVATGAGPDDGHPALMSSYR